MKFDRRPVILAAGLLLFSACSDEKIEWGDEIPQAATIPAVGSIPVCVGPGPDPEEWACLWYQSFDAVVVAGIDAANLEFAPSIIAHSNYPDDLHDECEVGNVAPVISLDVTILHTFSGELERGQTVTVRFGADQDWYPLPIHATINGIDADDPSHDWDEIEPEDIDWYVKEEFFEPGKHVGLGLFYHTDPIEAWSTTVQPLFFFGDDGLDYQERGFPCTPSPWPGASLEELEQHLEACPTMDEADERRESIKTNATNNPRNYIATNCFVGD